jgi:hypothetical protein
MFTFTKGCVSILIKGLGHEKHMLCHNPTLEEWEDDYHTPEMGTWESVGTPKTLEFDCKGWNTSHWGVLYIIGKILKCKCRKWAPISHLDIFSTSYDKKKGRELNWQFDSRPLKVGNRPDSGGCRWSATYHWKDFEEGYNFASNLIAIRGLHKKLCSLKVAGVLVVGISGLSGKKAIWMWPPWRAIEYTIWGKVVASPWVRAMVSLVSPSRPWLVLASRGL